MVEQLLENPLTRLKDNPCGDCCLDDSKSPCKIASTEAALPCAIGPVTQLPKTGPEAAVLVQKAKTEIEVATLVPAIERNWRQEAEKN